MIKHIAINAHLLGRGSGYRSAGIHRYIYGVLSNLPALDESLRYTVMLNHPLQGDFPRMEQRQGMFNTDDPKRRIVWEQVIQPLALRQIRPDLYHAMAFVGPRLVPCPSVVTVYDLSFIRYPEVLSGARRQYLQAFTQATCQRATRVIAISESTADDVVKLMGIPREKIDVAVPGVSDEFCPLPPDEIEAFRREKNLPERFFFFLGTLEPRKNLPMLLRAYAQLPKSDREAVHLILGGGKGWMYDEIFATIEHYQLADTVHVPGFVDSLVGWYNAAEALVYPTLFEGFGMPIVEAMACGTPVIASNTSSLPEAAGEAGVLLPPDDESAWTQALARMIHDSAWRAERSQRGRAWAANFTWERTALETVLSYQRVLK
ncbi:MAG: glycosyltransferase family 4 protein [Chloroflexi bacterium]|nr:glycosyltransferase family 4 protein [Chloroflexota bacterium]